MTICGGVAPEGLAASTSWDVITWASARAATLGRRQEDLSALNRLQAVQSCGQLLDLPYRSDGDDEAEFANSIDRLLEKWEFDEIAIPLASGTHRDHVLTRDAALGVLSKLGRSEVYLYADLPYYLRRDAFRSARELNVESSMSVIADDAAVRAKNEAVNQYHSQVPLLKKDFGRVFKTIYQPGIETLFKLRLP